MNVPEHLIYPIEQCAPQCLETLQLGCSLLKTSKLAIVGLARDCAASLLPNIHRALDLCPEAADFAIHIEENDSADSTKQILLDACRSYSRLTATMRTLDRPHRGKEFAGPRTIALAEYRANCQEWVRDCASDSDFVMVVDWDQRGGWSQFGVLNGFGWLAKMPEAFGMASVSLLESYVASATADEVVRGRTWVHYDAWALRLNALIDDYSIGNGGWKHQWIPFVGTDPVPVRSAFGGLCIYRTADYLAGTYSGEDCEHVTFHRTITERTGRSLYINPTQRCVMQWLE